MTIFLVNERPVDVEPGGELGIPRPWRCRTCGAGLAGAVVGGRESCTCGACRECHYSNDPRQRATCPPLTRR